LGSHTDERRMHEWQQHHETSEERRGHHNTDPNNPSVFSGERNHGSIQVAVMPVEKCGGLV